MNYRHRCTITTSEKVKGYLGEDEVQTGTEIVPCAKSALSLDEQISVFGKYTSTAFKLHLRGKRSDISAIEFDGINRNIVGIRYHKNSTMVIIS